jgi:hypothetical protein
MACAYLEERLPRLLFAVLRQRSGSEVASLTDHAAYRSIDEKDNKKKILSQKPAPISF